MPHVPVRPPALERLCSATASAVLAKHFGDFAKAARELGVYRKDLQQLSRHNPRILNAAHERMELFRIGVKSKILEAVYSRSASRRRGAVDAMFDSYEFRDHPLASARWAAPAQHERAPAAVDAQLGLEREAAAELERERAAEVAGEQAFELEGDRRREGEEIVVDIEPSVNLRKALPAQGGSLWPAGIRRPSKRGWR
jgi:hypothetical protein